VPKSKSKLNEGTGYKRHHKRERTRDDIEEEEGKELLKSGTDGKAWLPDDPLLMGMS
jgi:hypothetical protein